MTSKPADDYAGKRSISMPQYLWAHVEAVSGTRKQYKNRSIYIQSLVERDLAAHPVSSTENSSKPSAVEAAEKIAAPLHVASAGRLSRKRVHGRAVRKSRGGKSAP